MTAKGFGAKEINISGEVGTPTIESDGNLNINAVNVAISTTLHVGTDITAHAGILTATNGFVSDTGSPVKITVSGSTLTFTVGAATTSLTLS